MTRRPLWIVAVLLLAAAAALWGSTRLSWVVEVGRPAAGNGVGGTGTTTVAGAVEVPSFTPLALLAVAALAGVVALRGWPRRVLGAVVAGAGVLACWQALSADVVGGDGLTIGRGVATLGGLLLVAAGAVVITLARRLPTLGARYQAANAPRASGDRDKDMWDGLSQGEDPTLGDAGERH